MPEVCPRCGSRLFLEEDEFHTEELWCFCGFRKDITKPRKPIVIPEEEIHISAARMIHGISSKTSYKIWRKSPAGRASIWRYQHSQLYYEAHARHRLTELYRLTQEKFKERRKFFKSLVSENPEPTCPLNLFYKGDNGEIYNNQSKCNTDGNGNCMFGCIDT